MSNVDDNLVNSVDADIANFDDDLANYDNNLANPVNAASLASSVNAVILTSPDHAEWEKKSSDDAK